MFAENNIITRDDAITLDLRPIDLTVKNDNRRDTLEILFIKHGTYKIDQVRADPSKTIHVQPGETVSVPKELFFEWNALAKIGDNITLLSNLPLF
jgi:hypothetical protein